MAAQKVQSSGPEEVASLIRWVAAYIEWLLKRRLGELHHKSEDTYELREHGQTALKQLRLRIPRSSTKSDEVTLEGISDEAVDALESVLRPASDQNPFTSDFVKARNYLAWRLFTDTGARRAEVHEAFADNIIILILGDGTFLMEIFA